MTSFLSKSPWTLQNLLPSNVISSILFTERFVEKWFISDMVALYLILFPQSSWCRPRDTIKPDVPLNLDTPLILSWISMRPSATNCIMFKILSTETQIRIHARWKTHTSLLYHMELPILNRNEVCVLLASNSIRNDAPSFAQVRLKTLESQPPNAQCLHSFT